MIQTRGKAKNEVFSLSILNRDINGCNKTKDNNNNLLGFNGYFKNNDVKKDIY